MGLVGKLYYNHWTIGFIEQDVKDVVLSDATEVKVHWLKHNYKDRFFADPFLYSVDEKEIKVLVEDFPYYDKRGRISMLTVDRYSYELKKKEVILKQPFHMSYPFVCRKNDGSFWIAPEASESGNLYRYQMDPTTGKLVDQKILIDEPLLDSTIIEYNGKWWLFCTKLGPDSNRTLFIYYAEAPEGPYKAHAQNPVLSNFSMARPGGNIIEANGVLYRMCQECSRSYGEYINIAKVKKLNESEYEEEYVKSVRAQKDRFSGGLHTLNGWDGICVVDGLATEFAPIRRFVYESINWLKHLK